MIDKEFAIEILKQYREKPTLINEIKTVEETVWLDEALEMGIKSLKQESILDKIRTEIAEYKDDKIIHAERNEMIDIMLDIIDKYLGGDTECHIGHT